MGRSLKKSFTLDHLTLSTLPTLAKFERRRRTKRKQKDPAVNDVAAVVEAAAASDDDAGDAGTMRCRRPTPCLFFRPRRGVGVFLRLLTGLPGPKLQQEAGTNGIEALYGVCSYFGTPNEKNIETTSRGSR